MSIFADIWQMLAIYQKFRLKIKFWSLWGVILHLKKVEKKVVSSVGNVVPV